MRANTLRRLLLAACIAPLVSSCAGDLPSAAAPPDADVLEAGLVGASLRLSSGAGQMGLPGRPLSNPVVVRVLNAAGAPVADAAVAFAAPAGSGVEPGQARTDARGYASAVWTLGAVGPQALRVSAAGTTVEVAATGRKGSGALTSLVKTGGDGQGALPGAPLQAPLQVRVVRDDGTPVHDAALTWTASAGTLDRTASRSSSTGYSAVRWTLGPDGGAQTLTVSAPGVAPVVFRAAARGLRLIKMAGDDPPAGASAFSTAAAAAPSRQRMVEVRAVRLDGTPAGGAEVTWTLNGGGTVDRPVTRAGTNGYTHVVWTLGAGAQKLTASAPGAVPVTFETVGPPVPSILRIQPEGGMRVTAGQTGQVTATLHDNKGNQIHGYVYEWSTSDPAVATVDSEGVVQGVTAGRGKIFVRTAGLEWEIPLTVEPRLSEIRFVDQQHWQRMDRPYEGFDVSNGDMHIRVEVGVLARVDSSTMRLRGPGGEVVETMRVDKKYVGSELVWGISTYFMAEFLIPGGAEPGIWRLDRVVLFRNGESAVYTYADFEAVDLHGRAFDVRGAGVDVSPPEVRSVWPWHHTGRIEGAPGWYFVQLGILDHVSGAVSATATFRGPQGQTLSCQLDPRVAYDCRLPIPEGSGTWELVSVYAIDAAGNSATYTPAQIEQWNGPFTYNFIVYTFET